MLFWGKTGWLSEAQKGTAKYITIFSSEADLPEFCLFAVPFANEQCLLSLTEPPRVNHAESTCISISKLQRCGVPMVVCSVVGCSLNACSHSSVWIAKRAWCSDHRFGQQRNSVRTGVNGWKGVEIERIHLRVTLLNATKE